MDTIKKQQLIPINKEKVHKHFIYAAYWHVYTHMHSLSSLCVCLKNKISQQLWAQLQKISQEPLHAAMSQQDGIIIGVAYGAGNIAG